MQRRIAAALCCLFLLFAIAAYAEVKPAVLFCDHMVLQSGMPVPIWGTAAPGEAVKITFNGKSRSTTTGPDGKWMLHLSKRKAGGPYEMQIQGTNSLTIHDVLVGEVWLASGQSNMAFTVSKECRRMPECWMKRRRLPQRITPPSACSRRRKRSPIRPGTM